MEWVVTAAAKPWLVYTRVSTDDQVQGASLDMQQSQCRAMATATGVTVADVVVDDGYSGKDTKRPGMRRVLDMVERRELGGIIVWKLDRLTRNLRDLLAMVDLFTTTDTALVSLAEKIDTSGPMGRFTLHIMGAVAQLERETIQARVTAAMRHIRAKGGWCGGRVPLGCRIVGERRARRLEPDPATAPAVAAAFQAYVDGISLAQLATRLHEAGVTPRRRNPTNIQGNLHDRRLVEVGVVDAALFDAVAAIGGQRSIVRPRRQQTERIWPLRGLAYCGRCGAALIGSSGNGQGGLCHYLRCCEQNKGSGCTLPLLPAPAWEGAVVAAVAQAAQDQAWGEAWAGFAEDKMKRYAPVDERRLELEAKRGQVQARADRLLDLVADGTNSPAAKARLATMECELSAIDAELNEAIGTLAGYDLIRQQREIMQATIRQAAQALPTAALEDVNDVLQGVVSRVVIHDDPAAIELVLRVPAPPESGRRFAQSSRLVQRTAHRASEGPSFRWPVIVGRVGPRRVVRLGDPLAAMEEAQRALAAGRSEDLAERLGVSRRQAQRLMAGRATPAALLAVADRLGDSIKLISPPTGPPGGVGPRGGCLGRGGGVGSGMRSFLLLTIMAFAWSADATTATKAEHDTTWKKAMEESARIQAKSAATVPASPSANNKPAADVREEARQDENEKRNASLMERYKVKGKRLLGDLGNGTAGVVPADMVGFYYLAYTSDPSIPIIDVMATPHALQVTAETIAIRPLRDDKVEPMPSPMPASVRIVDTGCVLMFKTGTIAIERTNEPGLLFLTMYHGKEPLVRFYRLKQ